MDWAMRCLCAFQSTLPVKGATAQARSSIAECLFQSTLPVKGATCAHPQQPFRRFVSIHAPGEGSD